MAELRKPASVAANAFKSAKWDELVEGRDFTLADVPILELLCQWYAIVDRCMDDMDVNGEIQVAYSNDMNDIKALPQTGLLKQASAEIRALNKQLGICDGRDTQGAEKPKVKETKLYVIQANREARSARAASSRRA